MVPKLVAMVVPKLVAMVVPKLVVTEVPEITDTKDPQLDTEAMDIAISVQPNLLLIPNLTKLAYILHGFLFGQSQVLTT